MSENLETTHLRRLVRLRYAIIAGQVGVLAGVHFGLGVALPLLPMSVLILVLVGVNVLTQRRLASPRPVTQWEVALQLLADISQLTALLYLTGGYANPFIFMLLPPLAIAAAALTTWHTLSVVAATVLCYSFLLVDYIPLPVLDRLAVLSPALLRRSGMWVCFVVSAVMIVFFVVRTRQTLRQKDKELARARERAIENEHLVEIGALAAGTAHELGTPLGTISLIAEELEAEVTNPASQEQLRILRQQVRRCREAIDGLAGSVGEFRSGAEQVASIKSWLTHLAHRWRVILPAVALRIRYPETGPEPSLLFDRALDQALSSVVSNACRASDEVEILVRWNSDDLIIEVLDRGPGVPESLWTSLGSEPLGQRPGVEGLGLGLYLATGTVRRFGGQLALATREGGGTRVTIVLPLKRLRVDLLDHEHTSAAAAAR